MKKRCLLVAALLVSCASTAKTPTITDFSDDEYTTLTGTATTKGESVALKGDVSVSLDIATTAYKIIINESGVKEIDKENGSYASVNVTPGDRYLISTSGQELGISTVLFANDDKVIEEKLAKSEILNSFQVVVPESANKLYVNCNNKKAIKIEKITKGTATINQNSRLPSSFKIGTTNCGTFTATSGNKTKEECQSEWERLLNDNPTTLYGFEEFKEKFSSSIQAKDVLGKNNYFTEVTGLANNLAVSTSIAPETTAIVPVSDTFEGTTKSTIKYFALRNTFHMGEKEVAYYNVHFCADSHLSTDIYKDGVTYSAYLRHIQYEQIIQDASYYDEAVFAGDFNAATVDEYSIFTDGGCSLSNGGDFGTFKTHDDSTTDNIITTSGLKIDSVSVLTEYDSITDHYPMISSVSEK